MFDKYLKGENSFGMPNAIATRMRIFVGFMVVLLIIAFGMLIMWLASALGGVLFTALFVGIIICVPLAYKIGEQILKE